MTSGFAPDFRCTLREKVEASMWGPAYSTMFKICLTFDFPMILSLLSSRSQTISHTTGTTIMSLASLFRRAPRRFMTPGQLAAHLGPASTASAPSTAKPTPSPTPSDADEPTPGHPVVHPDLTREWPEMTPDVLRRVLGDKAVEVELGRRGRGYLDPGWQRVEMPFCKLSSSLQADGSVLPRLHLEAWERRSL